MTSHLLDDTLTDRQLRFVYEYLLDLNASAAAVRAGYAEASRAAQAHELMNNPAVRDRIRVELRSLLAEAGCSALDLMKERMKAAFFRADKLLGKGWEMLPSEAVEAQTLAALQVSASFGARGPVLRVRQPDRDKALRALERVHERLEDKSERYYASLAREGKLPSLEEIEAMGEVEESAEEGAGEFSVKTMVLSGCDETGDGTGARFPEKAQVLSGCSGGNSGGNSGGGGGSSGGHAAVAAPAGAPRFAREDQVLSGSAAAGATHFSEKPWVLSGARFGHAPACPVTMAA